ncbi:hypothetical protein [Brevundimonas diminuta]|uniref:hypothetical protein n=1 Tax=Brevundimonas diminuta TaxID=293 RepID=UPI001F598DF5|nr:hypothetical protein [Brevundimonas diminuta]
MTAYVLRRGKAEAFGYPLSDDLRPDFVVTAGSTALRDGPANVKRGREKRDTLVSQGVLAPHPTDADLYIFSRDHRFDSPSAAGDVINDGNLSAPKLWRNTATRASLKDDLDQGRAVVLEEVRLSAASADHQGAAADSPANDDLQLPPSSTLSGDLLAELETKYGAAAPEVREKVSRYIERGPVGDWVKRANGYRCQVCEALQLDPIGFRKRSGEPYVEAHHVMPVSKGEIGSLAASNILTVCANHHRQLHFGQVDVRISAQTFEITLDGQLLSITRPAIDVSPAESITAEECRRA